MQNRLHRSYMLQPGCPKPPGNEYSQGQSKESLRSDYDVEFVCYNEDPSLEVEDEENNSDMSHSHCKLSNCTTGMTPIDDGRSDGARTSAPESQEYPTDIGLLPTTVTQSMREYWIKIGSECCQNKSETFHESKVVDGDRKVRYCSKSYFTNVHELTSTTINRSWICYLPSTGKIYCFHCKLF